MAILQKRFERLKKVLSCRMENLTVLLENVEKPHNLSAILRSCDAVGVLEAHAISRESKKLTFNSTAQGSQKWVKLNKHPNIEIAIKKLKASGFKIYGTNLNVESYDYRDCNFTGPTAFVLGSEKWGLSNEALLLVDRTIFIPMRGMVQSLNVSVAASTLMFEALRQRKMAGLIPSNGQGLTKKKYQATLFEWAYPEVAEWCNQNNQKYPKLNTLGEIIDYIPRTLRLKC